MSAGIDLLRGVRVVDLAQFVAGSYATMLLGDLGADVVKVELPGQGDPYRQQGPEYVGGESTLFLALNRNKRALALDWKSEDGRRALLRLVERSDVFVENARPGSLAKYGFDHESLTRQYPRLVYCSISGYGQTGPAAGKGGFDLVLQAEGGIMAITGERGGAPVKVGAPLLDIGAALSAVAGVVAALYRREREGSGCFIETSLLDFSLAALTTVLSSFLVTGVEPERLGSASPSFAPYEAFLAADGYVALAGAGNESLWRRLCDVLDLPHLPGDPRFLTNADRVRHRDELGAIIEERLRAKPVGEWLAELEAAGVPAGRINGLGHLANDPQVRARGALATMDHPTAGAVRGVVAPLRAGGATSVVRLAAPRLGEHTRQVLDEAGLSPAEVETLFERGLIA